MSKVTITKSKLDNLANAVSAKSGEPVLLTVDEMTDAVLGINTGEENVLEGVKVNGRELPIVDKKVNIPAVTETQAGVMTPQLMSEINDYISYVADEIPTKTSDLTNDSNFLKASISNSEGDSFSINLGGNGTTTAGMFTSFMYDNGTKAITPFTITGNGSTGKITTSIYGVITPTTDDMAANKKYVDDSINGISIPTKTSDLTNDSGYITTETDPTVPAWAKASNKPSYSLSEINNTGDLQAIEGIVETSGLLRKTAVNNWSLDTNTYLTSYTETDPTVPSWAKQSTKPTYTAAEVGALPDTTAIPTKTSDLTNDSGYIITETDPTVPSWAKQSTKPSYTAAEVGAMSTSHPANNITSTDISEWNAKADVYVATIGNNISGDIYEIDKTYSEISSKIDSGINVVLRWGSSTFPFLGYLDSMIGFGTSGTIDGESLILGFLILSNNTAQRVNQGYIIPTKTSDLTNDSGFLTSSDIAAVLKYKGTKASYSALPSTGNTTGDVWHVTDTGAEYAWDGSTWQELGTAIDLSNYATKATTLSGYGITDAKIQNGTITLGSNTITPLTSYTETDPTVPSWAKASSKPSYALSEITSADDVKAIEALTGTAGLLRKTAANTWSLDTNTYLTSYTETDPTVPSWAKQSTKPSYTAAEVGALPDTTEIPSKTSDLTNDSGFITGYTETDPVFAASPAAGITSTNITNWNDRSGKVEQTPSTANIDIPILLRDNKDASATATYDQARFASVVTVHPSTGNLKATTFNGYTLAAACAKSVDSSISASSSSTNLPTSAAVASFVENKGYLTLATLPIYDGTVV